MAAVADIHYLSSDMRQVVRSLLWSWSRYRVADKTGPLARPAGTLGALQPRTWTIGDAPTWTLEDLQRVDQLVYGAEGLAPALKEAILVRYEVITEVAGWSARTKALRLGVSKSTYRDRVEIAEEEIAMGMGLGLGC